MAADELLEWASKRPAWQQEALRRLAEHGRLSNQDLDELQVLIEYSNGFPADKVVKPQPVREEHLRRGAPKEPTTILGSIGPLKNVDRLAAGQNPLRFAVDGITLVYGANGSGKSGYCRIAKRLCRSLHEAKLRGNVYEAKKAGPPEVNVTFKVGGEAHKREIVWLDTDEPPHELERISVFDSHAAGLYVDGDRKIEFLPSELDVLNKLAVVCQMIEERFQARENSLRAAVKAPLPVGYTAGTDAFAALQKLTTSTSLGELPTEARLRSLAAWSPADEERLNQLADDLKNDPDTLARTRRQVKSTLETLVSEIADLVKALSDAAVEDLKANRNDAEAKRTLP